VVGSDRNPPKVRRDWTDQAGTILLVWCGRECSQDFSSNFLRGNALVSQLEGFLERNPKHKNLGATPQDQLNDDEATIATRQKNQSNDEQTIADLQARVAGLSVAQ
jgi:hypothetical protein